MTSLKHRAPAVAALAVPLALILALALASGEPAAAQRDSRVDPLRSVATALVKPNALVVLDLSASLQCDLSSAHWPEGEELTFGSKDKRTCIDQNEIPTGVRVGDFFDDDARVLGDPTTPDDFAFAKWSMEYRTQDGIAAAGPAGSSPRFTEFGEAGECVTGSNLLAFDKKKVKWNVTNGNDYSRTITQIDLTWPLVNDKFDKVKVDAVEVYGTDHNAPSATIVGPWDLTAAERTLGPGESTEIRFEFGANSLKDPSAYQFLLTFDDGCAVGYNTVPPGGDGDGDGDGDPVCSVPPTTNCSAEPCVLCQPGGVPNEGSFRWRWHDASRLAVLKNLLGNDMAIETLAVPMTLDDAPTAWIDATSCLPDAPPPLPTRRQDPLAIIDANFDKINFGLGIFSCIECHNHNIGDYSHEAHADDPTVSDPKPSCKITNDDYVDACGFVADPFPDPDDPLTGKNPVFKTVVPINTDDLDYAGQEFVRDAIDAYLSPTYQQTTLTDPATSTDVTITGLPTYTGTPTPCAIRCARFEFEFEIFPDDERQQECKRKNYMILLTDGQSTIVNNGHNTKACGDLMPWDMADEMYTVTKADLAAVDNEEGAVRTFVVGLSGQTTTGSAREELNKIAFAGRTDASDLEGGVNIAGDDAHWSVLDPGHNYAFFAANASQLSAALRRIVTSIAAVDLATAPPVTTSTRQTSSFDGSVVGLLASSEYPEAYGHLRLFNLEKETTDPDYEIWDAGDALNDRDLVSSPRAIYTSDPLSDPPHQLIPLIVGDATSVAHFKNVLRKTDTTELTNAEAAELLKFLHGLPVLETPGDLGSPTHSRPWRLGDLVNSTPALRGAPPRLNNFPSHRTFGFEYQNRHTLVFVGASDLQLHAFDLADGHEVFSYLPPNLLQSLVSQQDQWKLDSYEFMGQPFASERHIYGVAASPRLADIEDGEGSWKTVLFSGEGPGGKALFALDVTSAYPGRTVDGDDLPADPNYDAGQPFEVLWFKTDEDAGFADLGESWSVPAIGFGARESVVESEIEYGWLAAFGSAYGSGDQGRFVHVLDALTGDLVAKKADVALADRVDQLVTDNYYFADTVGYSTESTGGDAPIAMEVQTDLAGQVWATDVSGSTYFHEVLFDVGAEQPLYFSPSVSTYRQEGPFTLLGYSSGNFDEVDGRVNGSAAVLDAHLFISVAQIGGDQRDTLEIDITDPLVLTKPGGGAFTDSTRPVSSPLTLIPRSGNPLTFFTLFDPSPADGDCFGRSYIVVVEYEPDPFGITLAGIAAHAVGSSKVSGFAVGSGSVVVGQSGAGGEKAKIIPVEDMDILPPIDSLNILQWKELF